MGWQVDNNCYTTQVQAAHAIASREVGKVVSLGAKVYVVDVTAVTASSITYRLNDVATTGFITKVAPVSPEPCGLLEIADGVAIGWGVAAIWLLTSFILFLRRGAHS